MPKIERKVTFERCGKKVRRTVRANSEAEFARKYAEILEAAERDSRITFEKVSYEWEEQHFPEIAYGTQVCYTPALRRARTTFGDKSITEIEPLEIERLLQKLAAQRYSEKTVKTQRCVISLIFKYAILNGYAERNPAEYVPIPKHLAKTERTPPDSETVSIIKKNATAPFGVYPLFLLYTGCRRGEALGIRWSDIDFDNNIIYIRRNVVFKNNRAVENDFLKTKAGLRAVPLLSPLRVVLEAQKRISAFVFPNADGELMSETQFNNRLRAYKKATGAVFTPHQLRHEFATVLYEAGVDEGAAQKIMGHADIRTTQNIYTHIRQSKIDAAAALLEKQILKAE